MKIIIDELEGAIYCDIILFSKELEKMKEGEMVEGFTVFRRKTCYVGVRMLGGCEGEKEIWWNGDDEDEDCFA